MVADTLRLSKRADKVEQTLGLLNRLTSEAGALLDVLGSGVAELTTLTAPIHARASALTIAQANIAASKKAVDELLEHLDTSRRVQVVLEQGPGRDLEAFLDGLQQLERSNKFLRAHDSLTAVRQALNHSQAVFDGALQACDADFRNTLAAGAKACVPSSAWLLRHSQEQITGDNAAGLTLPLVPPSLLPKLSRMAALLLEANFMPALEGYANARSKALEMLLRASGKEVPALTVLQGLPSEQLDRVVQGWAGQLRTLALLLLSERRLADGLWRAPHNEALLAQVAGRHVKALVQAGRDIMDARRTPDRVLSLLDMHQQLDATLPALALSLGDAKPCKALVSELVMLHGAIASAAAALFGEYEESVARDASKVVVADGTIHPVCAQVLSYLKRLLTYDNAQVVLSGSQPGNPSSSATTKHTNANGASNGSSSEANGSSGSGGSSRAAMAAAVARVLERLVENLGLKARAYKSDALGALFMMNNVHYMAWSVEGSTGSNGALELLGQEWVEKRKDMVEDFGAKYHDLTWMPLVKLLQAEMPPESDGARMKAALKDRYTRFNEALERICASQSGWTIPDPALKAAVKRVVKADLIKPYQDFLRQYAEVPFTQNPAKYIKYAAADVAAIVDDDLFESRAPGAQGSKLSLRKEKLESFT